MKNTKVLLCTLETFSSTGGIQTYNKTLIKALTELGVNLSVISLYDSPKDCQNKNLNFKGFNGEKIKASLAILKESYSADIVISTHIYIAKALLPIILLKLAPNKFFFSAHGIEVWTKLSLPIKIALKYSTLLPVSNFTKKKLIKFNPSLSIRNIKLLPNCLPHIYQSTSEQENLRPKLKFQILAVSRLIKDNIKEKGIPLLMKAVALAQQQIPQIELTIIGKGNAISDLKKLKKKLKLENQIQIKGYVENLESFYSSCDVFALPSITEGFGIVYLEAMNFSKPVIGANGCGSTDIIIDKSNGFLCSFNPQELAEKLIYLYKNPKIAKKMGKNGKKLLCEKFSFSSIKQQLKQIIINNKS